MVIFPRFFLHGEEDISPTSSLRLATTPAYDDIDQNDFQVV
jgi:hypothetical protein